MPRVGIRGAGISPRTPPCHPQMVTQPCFTPSLHWGLSLHREAQIARNGLLGQGGIRPPTPRPGVHQGPRSPGGTKHTSSPFPSALSATGCLGLHTILLSLFCSVESSLTCGLTLVPQALSFTCQA